MAGAMSVDGNEGHSDPVPVSVLIRPIQSHARLSLFGFFSIGTVPFPRETVCPHPLCGCPGRPFTMY